MKILPLVVAVVSAVVLKYSWKLLNSVWLKPKQVEKRLRRQGLKGNSYRLLFGDLLDESKMMKEANSKPLPFTHDIPPRLMPLLDNTVKKYGNDSFIWLGPKPAALVMDPESIREVLLKSYIFQKPPTNHLDKLLAQGLASYEADKWAKHRRLINPAFHLEKLKEMIPAFYLSFDEMLGKWEKIVPAEGSCELDVWPYLQALTGDAISRSAFGSNYEEGKMIFELQKEQTELVLKAAQSVYLPGLRFLPTKTNKRMKEIAKEVELSIMSIINKRMEAMEAGGDGSNDLLGMLLESNYKETQQQGTKHGMSLQDVFEECRLFYIAGQETTSVLLVWTMILLSKYMDWQAQARQEVIQIFGGQKPDLDKLNQLKTVTMILHEVLRLYPPLVMIARVVEKEIKLGKVSFPAGMLVFLPTLMLHHDREIWGEDVNKFNPERFSEGVSKATKGKQFVYFPFGGGPRICVGQNFAMLEAKMVLAMILQKYTFELSPSYAHSPHTVITLQPQYGAQLIMHKI